MIGGAIDIKQLFRDLAKRVDNPFDDGWVDGHVSLADKATQNVDAENKTNY